LAEVPKVRKDMGYPPLVTPTSQIVGSQAVLNVLTGERYKMATKETKALLRGEYGRLPGPIDQEVRKKCGVTDDELITCRPADLLQPELAKYKAELGDRAKSEEDVLSYALFPQVAMKFFDKRDGITAQQPAAAAPVAQSAPVVQKTPVKTESPETTRSLYVEDLSGDNF
jgi:oxaloacetate decarboxylase alpha subunit